MKQAEPKRAVLVGAGHAHLRVIREAASFRGRGHEVVVVAPGPFWYSGLATGMLGGWYPPSLDRIDIVALAARSGARLIRDTMTGLDRGRRIIRLKENGDLAYDVLSLNLGSEPPPLAGAGAATVYAVKPIERLLELRNDLQRRFATGAPTRIIVAGGGPTGCELAANIAALARRHAATVDVLVLAAGERMLDRLPHRPADAVRAGLERRGVRFRMNARVLRLQNGTAVLEGGGAIGFDIAVNATGLKPAAILGTIGLPLDAAGALVVDRHLRSPADPRIHGGGDCVALQGHHLPRIGVYAIRQAPVLLRNLLAALDGGEPYAFIPQRRALWIMNLGDGSGLAVRGRLWWRGKAAFRLKDWIDRRFLRRNRA